MSKTQASLLLAVVLLMHSTAFAGFTFGTSSLKQGDLGQTLDPTVDSVVLETDLLSHHLKGTWVAYDESYLPLYVSEDDPGWIRLHLFPWWNFAAEVPSSRIYGLARGGVRDSDPSSPSICNLYLETDPGTGNLGTMAISDVRAIDMDASSPTNSIYLAVLVQYSEMHGLPTGMQSVYTLQYSIANATFSNPILQVQRYGMPGTGQGIDDVSLTLDGNGAPLLFWTEWKSDYGSNVAYRFLQGKYLSSPAVVVNCQNGDFAPQSVGSATVGSATYAAFSHVDAIYDNHVQRDEILLAVDQLNENSFSVNTYVVAKGSLVFSPVSQGSINDAHDASIDCYSWNSTRDFAVAYQRRVGTAHVGVGFSKYNGTSFAGTVATTNADAERPSICCYAWGTSSAQWNSNASEVVVWQQGDKSKLCRKTGGAFDTDIILAQQKTGHASSTSGNQQPMVACPTYDLSVTPPPAFPLNGFYTLWHDGPNTLVYGKRSDSVSFKSRTVSGPLYVTLWVNYKAAGSPLPGPFTIVSYLSSLVLNWYSNPPADVVTYNDGMIEYRVYNWYGEDQAYYSRATYTISVNGYIVKLVYVDNHYDNDVRNDPYLTEHPNTGSFQTETTGRWNFWEKFPATYNQLGLYMPHDGSMGISQYSATVPQTPYLEIKYLDWAP